MLIFNKFHRGHSVFDTLDIVNGRMLLLEPHLARLQISCSLTQIPLPFPIQMIRQKILDVASFCITMFSNDFDIRYWVSGGGNNFGILPDLKNNKSTFFIVAFESSINKPSINLVDEVSIDNIEAKAGILANAKTTNYLINSLYAIEAVKRGGNLGVMIDRNGDILEGPISNIAFVFKNGDFVIPKLTKILRGTTLIECMQFIEKKLIKEGKIKRIVQKDLKPEDIYENAVEMLRIGGNKITVVRRFNGRLISEQAGPIASELFHYLTVTLVEKSEKVPVDLYRKAVSKPKL